MAGTFKCLACPRIGCGKCPETSTVFALKPALWDTRFLGKPFHTLQTGIEWWKEKHLARWNDAELQSARRGRGVTGRRSHVRESKKRHGFRSSTMSPFIPIFIVLPPVYSHTAFLDDFFWRSFPYTQVEATRVFRTRGESSPLSKDTSRVCAEISTCFSRRVPDPRRVRKESPRDERRRDVMAASELRLHRVHALVLVLPLVQYSGTSF